MDASDAALIQAREVAQELIGDPVEVHHILAGGRNSRIYRVDCGERAYALKQYPSRKDDPRDRLTTEVGALRLMERHRLKTVPRVVGVDPDRGYALLSWIEGSQVSELEYADIDAAVAFLAAIHALRDTPWAAEQPLAAEACLSGAEIERQLTERLMRLRALPEDGRDLVDFLDKNYSPQCDRLIADAKVKAATAGLDFATELSQENQSLVPSDFGFHNSLRRGDGSLAFVDFEYFGWDDPVKLTSDILLHPGSSLAVPLRRRFRKSATALYGEDRMFGQRLEAYLPLFGLRWVLILLNEFIPERWQRRVLAGASESWSDAKMRQLERARRFLASISQVAEV